MNAVQSIAADLIKEYRAVPEALRKAALRWQTQSDVMNQHIGTEILRRLDED